MTFADLDFQPHPVLPDAKIASVTLPNGVFVTIVGGPHMYGDGDETFEVAARQTADAAKLLKLGDCDDVLAWQTIEQVEIALRILEKR